MEKWQISKAMEDDRRILQAVDMDISSLRLPIMIWEETHTAWEETHGVASPFVHRKERCSHVRSGKSQDR